MKYSTVLLSAIALSLAALTGCAGHVAPTSDALNEASKPAQLEPVFIVPNCKNLGGETYCQWLEPRGYQQPSPAPTPAPAPEAATGQHVPGIAI